MMVSNSMPNTQRALQTLVLSHLKNEGVLFNEFSFQFSTILGSGQCWNSWTAMPTSQAVGHYFSGTNR